MTATGDAQQREDKKKSVLHRCSNVLERKRPAIRAQSKIDSIMLDASAIPFPAMSSAVP